MRVSLTMLALAVCAVVISATPSFAGGAGSAALLWQQDAICAAQRRGEGPQYPNFCQNDYPAALAYSERRRRR